MRTVCLLLALLVNLAIEAQPVIQKLEQAVARLENDSQMKSAIIGFYVIDKKNNSVVFNKNSKIGFASASTQKVITSATALETLGKDYRYKTDLAYDGIIDNGILKGNLYLVGSGDPSLGSWRYASTKENIVLNNWIAAISKAGIKKIDGKVMVYDKQAWMEMIPGMWTWDDMGNYYGAGATGVNWRENQYDIKISTGKTGDTATIVGTEPALYGNTFYNYLTAGKEGSGDNTIIYRGPNSPVSMLRGTVPPNRKSFVISGSMPAPAYQLSNTLARLLQDKGFGENLAGNTLQPDEQIKSVPASAKIIYSHTSPTLDSIVYWFLKKSINLYGEALIKTLGATEQVGSLEKADGSTESGVAFVQNFWKPKGIDPSSINMKDGSGLAPQNRLTPEALVKVMQYATSRTWFSSFYDGLPEINGLKMKSGSIGGARSYTGYSGDYIFAIVVNNYTGSGTEIQKKLWRVLDNLK